MPISGALIKDNSIKGLSSRNGLGLAIVKSIIDLHNGKIDILSQVDVGTVFSVKLPIEKQKFMNRLKL